MSSRKEQEEEPYKTKKPGNVAKDSGETSKQNEGKKVAPGGQGTQSFKSSGACGTAADEIPSKRSSEGGDPTKRNTHRRGRRRRKPREGEKVKLDAPSSEGEKANPDLGATMEPSKEDVQSTGRAKTESLNSQGATGPSGRSPYSEDGELTKQNIHRRRRRRGKPREGTTVRALSTEEGNSNLEIDTNSGVTQKTVAGKCKSSVSQDVTGLSASRTNTEGKNCNKQNKRKPKGRGKGASQEGDRGERLSPPIGKGNPSGKNQDLRPGNSTNKNARSATQREPQSPAGRPHNRDQQKSSPHKGNILDFKILKEKKCTEVVHTLINNMNRLKIILKSEQHNGDDFIFDLTCTLAVVCNAPANENTNKILAALKGSAFFSSQIPCLLDRVQKAKTTISDSESQRRLMECLIKIFNKYLMHLPSSYADPPYDPLKETLEKSNIDKKDELKKQLDDFKQRRDDIINAEREKKHGRRYTNKAGKKPPNDFREMPICPTNKEIKSPEKPFLRENIKKGRYKDVEDYLDVQFRLLQEDFLQPLREGIYEITHNIPRAERKQLMKCYQGVRIVGKELTVSGIIYNVQFNASKFPLTRWSHSKRLMFGSFLCFSKENFEKMFFATVANRNPKELQKGRFDIQFIEGQSISDIEKRQQEYQMVESPAFFEAYRHVLKGLKELNEDNMPFTKYLVECSADVEPPEYLNRNDDEDPVYYDLSKALNVRYSPEARKVTVLNPEAWPSVDRVPLNESQLEALRTAVTTEFSVIQGPPGTGKTYVGAKIVRCLLENREQWDPEKNSPMLMVCFTNHALDQFLEKVLEFLPKREIIRVGGRSKSKELEDCNVKVFTRKYRQNYARRYTLEEMDQNQENMREDMEDCENALAKADKVLLELRDLEAGMTASHADQFYGAIFPPNATNSCQNPPNTFKLWLCNNSQMNDFNQRAATPEHQSQDGSFLQEECSDEEDGLLYRACEPRIDESFEDGHDENATTEVTNGDTGTIAILVSDHSQLTSSQDKKHLNGTRRSDSMNVERQPRVHHEDLLSCNQSAEQGKQSLASYSHMTVSNEIDESTAAIQHEEKSLLLNVDNRRGDILSEHPDSVQEVTNPNDTDEETIAVENEVEWIQNQRLIEGEEEHTLLRFHQKNKGKHEEETVEEVIEDTGEWRALAYQNNAEQCCWKNEEGRSTEEERKEVSLVEAENSQKRNMTGIQDQSCIKGEGECTLAASQQSDSGNPDEENNEEFIEDSEEWTTVIYHKQHVWKRNESFATKGEETEDQCLKAERSQKRNSATQKSKTENKVNFKADIRNIKRKLQKEAVMSVDEAMNVENIWFLSAKDRLRLYLYWLECYRERHRIEIRRCEQHYEQRHKELCEELEEIKFQEEEGVIRRATVVGMTTSCAARYHSLLQRISPKIVIIEEAAEVMEAHIVTSLSRDTKHTVLIGDHKQLRPKASVYELAKEYNLEISLFERMVLNKLDCKRLSIQHRMRPEIAALTKRIYDHEIVDHESVCAFDDICGLKHNMFFIDHCQNDRPVGGLQSFSNPHEAGFLVALCRYLLLQGYKREQITILTMYTGQLLELQTRMPRKEFEGIKVCVVDNFQGEENDIILLSLVRSNSKIGFLKESNRICVALSRARQGFYCIGNFTFLKSQCTLWKEICDDLETKNAIGKTLTLVCKRHSNVNEVRHWSDFQKFPLGGCNQICGERLNCGHACDRPCHLTDRFHELGHCPKACWKSCPNGHQCQRRCHHPFVCCCPHPMVKSIPICGHEQTVPCCIEPRDFVCQVKCEKSLECGHTCTDVCGSPCTAFCKVNCCRVLSCGHEKNMMCFQDPKLYRFCKSDCDKILNCGHPCSKKCRERCYCNTTVEVELPCKHRVIVPCPKKDQPGICVEKCSRKLPCGHECPGRCFEKCTMYRCESVVEKHLPCSHTQLLPCHLDQQGIICQQRCQKQCKLGHQCQQQCHYGIPCKDCMELVNMTIPSCKHNIEGPCYLDPATLVCKKPCERVRICGHPCRGICGKNCEAGPCMEMVSKTLPCEHTVTVACNKKPETCKCKANVVVDLPCGHQKTMDCYAKNADLDKVLCNKRVTKELSCKHQVVLQCHTNPEKYKCKRKVDIKMTCSHTQTVICSIASAGKQVPCMVPITRTLPCEHEVTIPCYENSEEYSCQAMVDARLPCGHTRSVECSKQKDVLEDEKWDAKCDVLTKKTLLCGHEKEAQCFLKPEKLSCRETCLRPKKSCEHLCQGLCGEPCTMYPCNVLVTKPLRCGHKIKMRCFLDPESVRCPVACEAKLQCGHPCSGTCGNCRQRGSHEICQNPCSRFLICLHRCRATCGEPCSLCVSTCSRRCPHDKCKQHCSKPCKPCTQPCTWSCPHYQCNNLCGEECNRPRCDAPCPKKLPCGHPCIGLCGETCPALCAVCHAKTLSSIITDVRGNKKKHVQCLQLFDCGHIIKVEEMDAWMMRQQSSDVQLVQCPRCSTPITFSYRYGNLIKGTLKNIDKVKAQVHELAVDVSHSAYLKGKELGQQGYDAKKLKFPRTVLSALLPFPCNVHQMHERNILFLFALKNHFMILQEALTTQQFLAKVHTVQTTQTTGRQQIDVDGLFNVTNDALENIKEYLEQPQLDLKTLSRVHEHTRKLHLFSHVLEVQTEAVKHQIAFTKRGKTRLKLARDCFELFLQGDDEALDLQWLREIVNLLRREMHLPHLPRLPHKEPTDFVNFPGCQKGSWKLCNEGHVYYTGWIVRGGEHIPVGSEGCTRCTEEK